MAGRRLTLQAGAPGENERVHTLMHPLASTRVKEKCARNLQRTIAGREGYVWLLSEPTIAIHSDCHQPPVSICNERR